MRPPICFLLLLLVLNVGAQQQTADNTYTQTEIDLKLQLQLEKVEALQQATNYQREQIKEQEKRISESVDRQEKYVQAKNKTADWILAIIGIWVTFISIVAVVLGYWLMRRSIEDRKKIEEELQAIKRLREEIEQSKEKVEEVLRDVEKLKNEAHTYVESIKDMRDSTMNTHDVVSDLLVDNLTQKILSEKTDSMVREESVKIKNQIEMTQKMKKEDEYTFDDWFLKAFNAQTEKKFDEANFFYEKAVKTETTPERLAITYYNWGTVLKKLGGTRKDEKLFEQSIEKFEKATEIKVDYTNAYNNWGIVLSKLGSTRKDEKLLEQSVEKFEKAIKIKADDAQPYSNLGNTLSRLGGIRKDEELLKQSIEQYRKAIGIRADFADAYNNLGYTLSKLGSTNGDIAAYKEEIESLLLKADAIKKGTGNHSLACLYSLLDDKGKALEWMEKSLQHEKYYTRGDYEDEDYFANIKNTSEFKTLLDRYFPD